MKTPVYQSLKEAADSIKQGELGVIPTDTLYGLVAAASNEATVNRLYALKSREAKPGTVIAYSIDQLAELGIKRRYLTAVEQYWPGPISVIIPVGFQLPYLHKGKMSLAIRIPQDENLLALLKQTGPLLTTSANHPGKAPAVNYKEARAYFNDTVDFYVDGGDRASAKPSTIIRVVDDAVEVVRAGAVTIDEETGAIQDDTK